jgi:glycosyltransferase involved in cell wall biosynthesis
VFERTPDVAATAGDLPGVLMVIGAYYPELSGGGLPCREIVTRLRGRAQFTVLTTSADPSLRQDDEQDGVPVYRAFIDTRSAWSKVRATARMATTFWGTRRRFQIVHLHGFSQKSVLMVVLARLFGKRVVVTLTSVGHDDPLSMRTRGLVSYWAYTQAAVFAGVSPQFRQLYEASGLPPSRFTFIPNAVDTERFHPIDEAGQRRVREELGLPIDGPLVLFVGFFSREKGPDVAFEAFARASRAVPDTRLLFIGATREGYYEIDPLLAGDIRRRAIDAGLADRVLFVESTREIHRYFQAADLYILTSTREGLPVALLEGMASGLGCVATRLEGITDVLIDDGHSGRLVAPRDASGFAAALTAMLTGTLDRKHAGACARERVLSQFTVDRMVESYFHIYSALATNS